MFLYAGFFASGNMSVACAYKLATGKECATCGLTRSLTAFLHGRWSEGRAWNEFGLPVFGFFAVQFVARTVMMFATTHLPESTFKWDGIASLLLFLLCFAPLIFAQL
ncbi:DUF2752 domain-containing protein [Flaviaesturariibacter amylovorans]|uniref:DUF2752 domain-containing protein n=1 Tax=Flaviaesturariibacter amylovorans TaxID=1084520 RepID=A0ABP8GSR4_9BACT